MKKSAHSRIIIHFFISILLTGFIVFIIIPDFDNKYKVELNNLYSSPNQIVTYFDVDQDLTSEIVTIYKNREDLHIIVQEVENLKTIDQWNFSPGYFGSYGFADFNSDNLYEFYILKYNDDSANLYQITPIFDSSYKMVYLAKTRKYNEKIEIPGIFAGAYDLNGDGFKEIIYSFQAGFTQLPRQIVAWDIHNDKIITSPYSGTAIYYPEFYDLDSNGHYMIFGQTKALHNCDTFPYPDTTAWLMLLDNDLEFIFNPVPKGTKYSVLNYKPFRSGSGDHILGLHISNTSGINSELLLFDSKGDSIKTKALPENNKYSDAWLEVNSDYNLAYVIRTDKVVEMYDSTLELINSIKILPIFEGKPFYFDIDLDGTNEIIFKSILTGDLIVYRAGFRNPVTISLQTREAIEDISIKLTKDTPPLLVLNYQNYTAYYSYSLNRMYYLRYIIYLMIFIAIFYLIWLGYYMKKVKLVSSSKIMELEVKSISNQMESHFTLNTLNAIGSLYAQDDKEKADYYFGKYARLVRNTLINSDQISQTLEQELDYVRNYLDIQKFRMNDRFDYRISLGDSVDSNLGVPKMILFTFVENAIKHGIKDKQGKGYLEIKIENIDSGYQFFIEDNGIGRKKAGELSESSTGKGMKILDEILELYYQDSAKRVRYHIEDLKDESGNASGTRIIVTL